MEFLLPYILCRLPKLQRFQTLAPKIEMKTPIWLSLSASFSLLFQLGCSSPSSYDGKFLPYFQDVPPSIALKMLNPDQFPTHSRGAAKSANGDISVYLMQDRSDHHLYYKVQIKGLRSLDIESGHAASDFEKKGSAFEIANRNIIHPDSSILISLRPDGQALVIDEWVDSAVCESDPIFVTWGKDGIKRSAYSIMKYSRKKMQNMEYFVRFFGWKTDGSPDVRETEP